MAFTTTDQTALPSSSSSSMPIRWKYDVFLSFHGKDTRQNFTAHLYTALEQKGIYTFRDDEKLERGQYISLELLKAIKESKYAIIVFSKNYAFSKWCLIELAKIAECMKENGLTVIPVFYHVDPSHVRNQEGTFAEAFVKHGEDPDIHKKIQTWRVALKEVGNIAGCHLHADRDESIAIQEIIGPILCQLNRKCSNVSEELFGIDSKVDHLRNVLGKNSDAVCFVGICGMGGIGKTTLAEVVFNRIRNQFQATGFIGCVREESTGYHGLVSLQKQLLSQILEEKKINIKDVRGGMKMIKNRLFSRKVLIVLDNVDKEQQLEALAGNHNWFGPGSRIIVTSRDRHLLKRHVDHDIYMATGLEHANALQLFCWKAFKKPYPEENYVDLCKDFVEYANGLPLALKILGSSLYDRGTNEWESARDKLKANPNREVLDILEIGFHSLGVAERRLFLDIACFFKRGIEKYVIIDLLESSGYPPHIDLTILVDKSLLTVYFGNWFSMHDLLQEMGKEIVRRESPKEPGRRSRLWHLEDALEILSNNTGTNVVEGIVLNSPFQKGENLNAKTFSKMNKLRLLKIHYGQLLGDLSYLSNELRLLEWFGYPLKSFPSSFQPDKLVELRMPCSQIKQLWINGTKSLCKLKLIDLSYSQNLYKIPNFNRIPNLEKLILQECTSLSLVHQSIGVLKRLIVLNLRGCKGLANLPENIGSMECLEELDASETAITRLPSSISLLKNLQNLSFHGCKGLAHKSWKSMFSSWLLQKESSDRIGLSWRNIFSSFSSLGSLDLSDCNLLDGAIPDDLCGLSSLHSLNLSGNEFTSLTDGICQLSNLTEVSFKNCSKLQALPKLPSGIVFVLAENCASLNRYSDQFYMWCSRQKGVALYCHTKQPTEEEKLGSFGIQLPYHIPLYYPSFRIMSHEWSWWCRVSCGSSWEAEIPKWFYKQSTSSSIRTMMQYPTLNNNEWKGCALFVIYEVHELETSNFRISERSDTTLDLEDVHQFVCDFETSKLVLNIPKVTFVAPTGFWVYIPYVWFSEQSNNLRKKEKKKRSNYKPNGWRYIMASITTDSPGVEVKKLGMRILYESKDGKEFAECISRCSFGIFSGERSTFRKVAQCMLNLPTCQVGEAECVSTCIPCALSNEDHGLKGILLSLLLQCFEVKRAKNRVYKYIFPLKASPPWFKDHRFGHSIRIPLPANLYDDIRWIGFAVYACFAVKENPSVSRDSKTCRNFSCLLSTDDGCIQSSTIFPLTRDIFRESYRLLVFHIPRLYFTHKLNQPNAIRALFGTSSSDVEAHVCGMRVVYEHHVEGFVQTVVDCILGSPEEYHQGYKRSLVHQVNIDLARNVHQVESESDSESGRKASSTNHFDYSPTSQRLRICTSTETLPKQLPSSVEHLEDCFDQQQVFNNCFPQSDIPKSFCSHSGPLLTFRPCPDLYNSSDWRGIAVCAVFTFLKDSTLVYNSLGLEISRGLTCYFGSDVGWTISIHKNTTKSEFTESSWLNQCEFLWLLYIPRISILDKLKPWNLLKALFVSKSQALMVQKCGHALVYQENVEEFVRMLTHCSSTFPNKSQPVHHFSADDYRNSEENYNDEGETSVSTSSSDHRLRRRIYHGESNSTANPYTNSDKQIKNASDFLLKNFEEFCEFDVYDRCFPPSEIQKLFSHVSAGPRVTIDSPSNFNEATDIVGLVLCASFSVPDEYSHGFLENLKSQVPHKLVCHLADEFLVKEELREIFHENQNLDDVRIIPPEYFHQYLLAEKELKWISHLRGFNWLFYLPYDWLFDQISVSHQLTASITSESPYLVVQKCAIRVLHPKDALEMFQIVYHSSVSFFDNWNLFHKDIVREEDCIRFSTEIEECGPMDSGSARNARFTSAENQVSKTNSTILHERNFKSLLLRIFEGFDPFSASNTCLSGTKIPEWFSHHLGGSSPTIQLPSNIHGDSNWMGLAICTAFSVHEHLTVSQDNMNSNVSYHLSCQLDTDIGSLDPPHVFPKPEEKFKWFYPHGFIWLSYIPCLGSVRDLVGQWRQIQASVGSDCPSLMVLDCGLRLLYKQDLEEFEQTIIKCLTSPFFKMNLIFQSVEVDTGNDMQNNDVCINSCKWQSSDFDRCSVYNSCFPPCEILEWFNHHNNEPSVTFRLPSNLYEDSNWLGLALCASFSVDKDSAAIIENLETSQELICHLETDIGSVEPLHHVYHPTKEDFMLFQLGMFTWLSYVPRGSLPEWLNQCTRIKASIASDCPNLAVQKCGFRLIHLHDEVEFKQTIRHCVASLSDAWDLVRRTRTDSRQGIKRKRKDGH